MVTGKLSKLKEVAFFPPDNLLIASLWPFMMAFKIIKNPFLYSIMPVQCLQWIIVQELGGAFLSARLESESGYK